MDEPTADRLTRRGLITVAAAGAGAASLAGAGAAAAPVTAPLPAPVLDVYTLPQATAPWTEEGYVATSAGRLHWVSMGQGPAILLLHKLGGWVNDYHLIAPLLADRYRLIAIDAPGHGDSHMNGPSPFLVTQEECGALFSKTMDSLNVDRYAVVGNSMGGSIGLVMSVLWPQHVTKLVMISTAVANEIPLETIARTAINPKFEGEYTYEKAFGIFGPTRQTWEEQVRSNAAATWNNACERGVRRAGLINYLKRTPLTPMMIYGDRAGQGYRAFLPTLMKTRPDLRVETISNSGTFAHQDNPVATAALLKTFIG
jgi:pimeloyl-ACP methyl ester carboxylesterase